MPNERQPETYAQAIFDQAADEWVTPLKQVAASLASADYEALDSQAIPFPKKQEILKRVQPPKATAQVNNFLSLLASKCEMHLLPEIVTELDRYTQRGSLRSSGKVTSAVPLNEAEKSELESKLRKRFSGDTEFEYVVDPSILGGIIVRVGDKVIDGSVSGKLAALREKLK